MTAARPLDDMVNTARTLVDRLVKYRNNARAGALLVTTAPGVLARNEGVHLVASALQNEIDEIDELSEALKAQIVEEYALVHSTPELVEKDR